MSTIKTCIRKAKASVTIAVWAANVVFVAGLAFMAAPQGYASLRAYRETHVVVSIDTAKGIRDLSKHLTSYDFEQIKCLAMNSYFEARGEGQEGMEAVDDVVLNRVANKSRYPDGICQAVYESRHDNTGRPVLNGCQFSWYCDGHRHEISDTSVYEEAYRIGYNKYLYRPVGLLADRTQGADHYHNDQVNPKWGLALVARIGHHLFYR